MCEAHAVHDQVLHTHTHTRACNVSKLVKPTSPGWAEGYSPEAKHGLISRLTTNACVGGVFIGLTPVLPSDAEELPRRRAYFAQLEPWWPTRGRGSA